MTEDNLEKYESYEVEVEVDGFSAEYADCGSHKIKLVLSLDGENIQEMLNRVDKLKPSNKRPNRAG